MKSQTQGQHYSTAKKFFPFHISSHLHQVSILRLCLLSYPKRKWSVKQRGCLFKRSSHFPQKKPPGLDTRRLFLTISYFSANSC